MDALTLKKYKKAGPEAKLQENLVAYLRRRDWLVIETHGNLFQMGLPDLYAAHYTLGTRWVEVKNPEAYHFTPAQLQVFPQLQSKGIGIWILCYCDSYEYAKLFQPANWHTFLGSSTMTRTLHKEYKVET